MDAITIDCPHAGQLADFYAALLGWIKIADEGPAAAAIQSPNGLHIMAFQGIKDYTAPTWPWKKGHQQQMMHLDLNCQHLQEAVDFALSCGATLAPGQYFNVAKTMIDPAGHPFCLCPDE